MTKFYLVRVARIFLLKIMVENNDKAAKKFKEKIFLWLVCWHLAHLRTVLLYQLALTPFVARLFFLRTKFHLNFLKIYEQFSQMHNTISKLIPSSVLNHKTAYLIQLLTTRLYFLLSFYLFIDEHIHMLRDLKRKILNRIIISQRINYSFLFFKNIFQSIITSL